MIIAKTIKIQKAREDVELKNGQHAVKVMVERGKSK